MEAYSLDLRERIIQSCLDDVDTREEIAEIHGVSRSFVQNLWRQWRLADMGRTLIEKFEAESRCDYAVVFATGDDLADSVRELKRRAGKVKQDELRIRARQNVIFELGYFVGKLGRDRVMLITDPKLELPTDISGVVYTLRSEWVSKLWAELKAIGYSFSADQIQRATAIRE